MELILIRHGESEANMMDKERGGFYCGRWDCHLTEKGRQQAASLRENTEIKDADAVFVSPLIRARETAEEFADQNIIIDERLTERSLGEFEGKWKAELENIGEYRKYFSDEKYAHLRASFTVKAPGGEDLNDVTVRVAPFLSDLRRQKYRKVIIVSHAIAIKCMLKVIENLSEEEVLNMKVRQCEPIRVQL
ncbi:MAG: histidine phosphatase family protein [Erysipelotrichaceae bacterium]|nr:histidine phosphatase family protein [Erysipelotrichaceae bacterium]